jgi:hypothetical protein
MRLKLAKEKLDLGWLYQPEYEILLPIWEESSLHTGQWTSHPEEFGFRRSCYTEKGRGTSTQRIYLTVRQHDKTLALEIVNPGTGKSASVSLPFAELIPSPRQFQKLVFLRASGDRDTLSASKTNLRTVWKEFVELLSKMPVLEHGDLHTEAGEYEEG